MTRVKKLGFKMALLLCCVIWGLSDGLEVFIAIYNLDCNPGMEMRIPRSGCQKSCEIRHTYPSQAILLGHALLFYY